ncbi:MAG: glycosyltransferase family 2 protein [Gammaproteobacteria bacterium]|nr:glycosyltransferase family 2 protein [Gammaproteobacteria bacterium]MCK5091567.1 glycosyltransferase family 2 protein [Gammaproteobacteria bacterium]
MVEAKRELLSIVVPAYNEHEVLAEFHKRVSRVLSGLPMDAEILYVNDGSTDGTLEVLRDLQDNDDRVAIVDLSRNFGKEIALTAGMHKVNGDAVVVIDADLQDPPELIPELIKEWKNGYDVVYAKRIRRLGESFLKKATANLFYSFMQGLGRVKIPRNTGDFRLLSKRAVHAVNSLNEYHRFMKGLFTWIGYPQKAVPYQRDPRQAGQTKWNYWGLWNLAIEGVTSFTTIPLRISTYIGLITAICAFFYGVFIIVRTLLYGDPVAGYPSLIVIVLFLGGVQLTAIGILGEYLGRIFNETKQRPLYFINAYLPRRQGYPETPDNG